MYVSRIVVRNYRNLSNLDVGLNPGVTCVVGENNTGKTNLLRAIRLPVDATLSSQYRTLLPSDFSSGRDYSSPQQILVSLGFRDYAGKENEEAMVAGWAINDNLARITYRFRPRKSVIDAFEENGQIEGALNLDDYRWEIVGAGGNVDPASVEWNETFGKSIRFDELQQFIVFLLPPLRDVEQALRQSRLSPLNKLLTASAIPEDEQTALVNILSEANESIAGSKTISDIGGKIEESFAEASGAAFRMKVDLGMAAPSFNDISRSLTVLLSNKSLSKFDPSLNGLGLNNVLYVSMLLRFFEERIKIGKSPGQLLLFEEPEAHLHPQLQRVLFRALLRRPFQTIATTHSTHITSQVALSSIVVLTDDGTATSASCTPARIPDLSRRHIADLERYLDATRGSLLYARKVMLVEGPAELFLIPPLIVTVLGIDLEEQGISLIPIFGVHFEAYARLFGKRGITKRCAIVTDGDLKPSDASDPREGDPEGLPELVRPDLRALENEFVKVFACRTTFEREITDAATIPVFVEAARELGAVVIAKRLQQLAKNMADRGALREAKDLVLATSKRFGKARFSQIASKHARLAGALPEYIEQAVKWLMENEAE